MEDGSLIHDHIILKPLTISIEGDVSDVHLRASPLIKQFQTKSAEIGNLTSIFAPSQTQSQLSIVAGLATSALDAVNLLDNLLDKGDQIFDMFGNRDTTNKSNQKKFLHYMEAAHVGRQLIDIDMPFKKRQNMRITSFTLSTDNQTDATTFTLEAEKMNFAKLIYAEATKKPAAGTGGQTDSEKDKGAQEGKNTARSVLSWTVQK
ncbi:MAG: hypothetical protein JKY80_01940 [Mariprofundaceae bacterium]|nr:hypothetical protein [Mariprofundaceae bacterium]